MTLPITTAKSRMDASVRRLVRAVLAEQHDEWAEARRYLTIPNAVGNDALPAPPG